MNIEKISYSLAFLAGLASFLSPCVLALVPAYIGFLGSQSTVHLMFEKEDSKKLNTLISGLFFVLGFSFVFILLGSVISAIGGLLYDFSDWLARIGGIFIIILGLHSTGIIKIPFLMMGIHYQKSLPQNMGYFSAFLVGVIFSAGWSPCIGPVLGAILTLSLQGKSILFGATLLAAYSMGMALPFLFAAVGLNWVLIVLKKYGKVLHVIQVVMGIILVFVGVLLVFDVYAYLARFGTVIDFGL